MVRRILENVSWYEKKGMKYDGKDSDFFNKKRSDLIQPGSFEEELIADWMEQNLSFRNTLIMVNSHRVQEEKIPVGRNTLMHAFDRMVPLINII